MRSQVVLFAAALALSGCTSLLGGTSEMEEIRVFVNVAPVKQGRLDRTLKLTGSVDAGRAVDLIPEVPGKVVRLPFKVGQTVQKGELVARLDLELVGLQKTQADAAVKLAELGLETAEREFGRAETLHETGSLTDQQFEQARAGLDMAALQLTQARAGLGLARYQVDSGVLKAPFDGIIAQMAVEEGAYYNPMTANPLAGPAGLVSIVDLDTIKIDLQVADRDVALIEVGMPAKIDVSALSDLLPPDGIEGVVDSVGYAADPVSRTFPVRVVAANPDHIIRAGTHATVLLVLERIEDALSVPEAAVLDSDDATYVVAVDGGVASRVPVEVGLIGDDGVEVRGALARDMQVGVRGHFGLTDGAKVEVVR